LLPLCIFPTGSAIFLSVLPNDGSGHQIGRADGLRRMQIIVYFYFFI
jgi:hypothetical protein